MKDVLLTGATGLVGGAILRRLTTNGGVRVRALVRRNGVIEPSGAVDVQVVPSGFDGDLPVGDQKVVIHSAARVHVMRERALDPLTMFRNVNVGGTLNLARQAAAAGARRFIFISSVKVNGEETLVGKPFAADNIPAPIDPYAISKFEAENGLWAIAKDSGMEVVIIRPVLVYGPGVGGNFLRMMNWLSRGIPLPLGTIDNRRSLVAVDNLVDLVVTCIDHPSAANEVFLVSDGEDLSTPDLLQRMGRALGRPAHLFPVPRQLLEVAATLAGKGAEAQRLCGSLQVDISKTRRLLNWSPPVTVDKALDSAARDFIKHKLI